MDLCFACWLLPVCLECVSDSDVSEVSDSAVGVDAAASSDVDVVSYVAVYPSDCPSELV